ncbi:hypothetical protein BV898_03547 [Hypsibius exemplaris]|uniref:Receptor ligand binding region domain-containing protein n=1 Tax=Hypsibius exemplaris TaxID=2072580 RepID=A0A1W0X5P0_HYPEX|nr:hypothetical protein BV898_03547 [Hypsibius exemplaris]
MHTRAAYASMILVAQVADQLRHKEPLFDFNDGALLARQFFGRTFETKVGNISFDELGQSLAEIGIGYYDPAEDEFVPFLSYKRLSEASKIEVIGQVRWMDGVWPVPSEPLCGFQGLKCAVDNAFWRTVGGATAGALAVSLSLLFITRRVLREQMIHHLLWWNLDPSLLVGTQLRLRAPSMLQRFGIAARLFAGSRVGINHSGSQFERMAQGGWY